MGNTIVSSVRLEDAKSLDNANLIPLQWSFGGRAFDSVTSTAAGYESWLSFNTYPSYDREVYPAGCPTVYRDQCTQAYNRFVDFYLPLVCKGDYFIVSLSIPSSFNNSKYRFSASITCNSFYDIKTSVNENGFTVLTYTRCRYRVSDVYTINSGWSGNFTLPIQDLVNTVDLTGSRESLKAPLPQPYGLDSKGDNALIRKDGMTEHHMLNSDIVGNIALIDTNTLPMIPEALELLTIIRDCFKLLQKDKKTWRRLLRGTKVNTNVVRDILNRISSAYLALKFGPLLTMQEYGVIAASLRKRKETGIYTKFQAFNRIASDRNIRSTIYVVNNPGKSQRRSKDPALEVIYCLERLGLFPSPSNIWDLVPLSFIINWFIPIDKHLERFWNGDFRHRAFPIIGACYSVETFSSFQIKTSASESFEVKLKFYDRQPVLQPRYSRLYFSPKVEVKTSLSQQQKLIIGAIGFQKL